MERATVVPIKDVYFGKLDAYSECLEYGRDIYQSLFYACPSFHVERFLDGNAYYIHGDKGTGKTALLKHIEITASNNDGLIEYIRFKKDVDEEQRNALKRAGIPNNPFEEVIEKDIPMDMGIYCVYAWQVYIIKCIVSRVDKEKTSIFEDTSEWKRLKKLIYSAYKSDDLPIKRILPKIKRGNIKLDIGDALEIGADFEWENSQEKTVSFTTFAKKAIDLFSRLKRKASTTRCYILFDELELIYLSKKSYQRDVALIRDLVQAIYYINEICKLNNYKISVIACLRNEVYRSVASVGYELNKLVQDYGVEISWQQSGGSIRENPLIKMIVKRLINSQPTGYGEFNEENIWSLYFEEYVNINYQNQTSMNYIIDQTWNKPRDVIRLLNLIKKKYESVTKIDISCFEGVRKIYSSESWEEFSNELAAKYSQLEIAGIKNVLVGIDPYFSEDDFSKRVDEKAAHFESVKQLKDRHSSVEIMADLYRVGIVGTNGKWKRFYFKGDQDFDSSADCVIHYPLRRFFSV